MLNLVTEEIEVLGQQLLLTNQRAIVWKNERALILSDLHIGKSAHFRRSGIPMPKDILQRDLERLELLLNTFHPVSMIIVGDLFHAGTNTETHFFNDWLREFTDLKVVLVKGNHDQFNWQPDGVFVESAMKYVIDPFVFVHDPKEANSSLVFTISGHLHPGIKITGKGKQRLKIPCFEVSDTYIILPAFSQFTGLSMQRKNDKSAYYGFTENQIFKL